MSKIKIMDELLANKIAAGEVVERCASVVKELVENSIDAKASEIKIELIEAGTKQIKVIDNGNGMDKEDAVLAFGRHATSKIKTEEDLYRIETLGFRGEALASIASVSEIVLKTCNNNVGTLVQINGGKIINISNDEARIGTIMEINNLFYNTPARLKHMKSLYTELASITDYVDKIALSHPEIRFTLTNNNNVILNTDGTNNLLKTINAIYGINITKKMLEIKAEDDDYIINGYVSLPEIQRSSRNTIITLVNNRVVRNSELNRIINDAYHSYKPDNKYPVVVINIEVDPSLVDVNVHPTKMDIKFSKFEELKELIFKTIKNKLKNITLIPQIEIEKEEVINNKPLYKEFKLNFDEIKEDTENYIINEDLSNESQEILTYNYEEKKEKERLPIMYPIGVIHGTYIICQNENGMYLMDQHAAKERINYEICLNKLSNPSDDKIKLLIPLTLEYTNNEYIILSENLDFLNNMNFDIEQFGINSVIVKSHPTWLPVNNEINSIKKVIDLVISKEKNFNLATFRDNLASTMACKMSIKGNEKITLEEMENLINDLRSCDNPFNCPHGRPTIIYYSKADLEKLFKRSGF
ncbi:MAG: DNA mismatch repair endonuclease MutL [Bacilli bacterium]|nr:DNA mismatch repair endonuclease MutL [Bacilli bacterium]